MLVRKCIEVVIKQLLPPRPLPCALGTQSAHWLRTKSPGLPPPKKPRNAYNFYVQSKYAEMKEKDPSINLKDQLGLMAIDFQNLSKQEADKYKQLQLNDQERYKKEAQEFQQQMGDQDRGLRQKILLAAGKPKRAPNAFLLFRKEYVAKFDNATIKGKFSEVAKETSDAWKNLSDSEKSKYHKEYERLKEEYKVKLDNWTNEMASQEKSKGKRS